ncbi:GTPase IMAP family member 4-like isoform X2 [Pomacea canaliculata]|uniref:GTPase IMAP family member 4-like isoform X2 n=1 Tax=Pomacea canaliculata TaxID=400727 RepID=UPI000D7266D5|nr:GTPase IMAP family member 4-like isoform X2 [Pomacea canaliculata]XP_025083375.1 GTPase IMAP family member 4-like isoform X2 [Pomacea canaliculata]XP_025083376.1 GTPase IMAP family member 4-like isoform X2 [Pomacea canaliculata]
MTSQGYRSLDTTTIDMDEIPLLIIGKTGNGKSSLGNAILRNAIPGKPKFQVSTSMASETTRMSQAAGSVFGKQIKVIDTPDLVNLDLSDAEIYEQVSHWKLHAVGKFAILLAVRCDVRYTAEEYDIYRKMKRAWGDNSFTNHLVVVFTFGDRQDRDIHEELKTVCWELRSVLADAGNRYVLFNNRDLDSGPQVLQLLDIVDSIVPPPSPPSPYLIAFVLLLVIFIIALWFGLPWNYELKTPVFFVIFVMILVGTIGFVYRRRLVNYINFAMLM